jgi:hypothetical protein
MGKKIFFVHSRKCECENDSDNRSVPNSSRLLFRSISGWRQDSIEWCLKCVMWFNNLYKSELGRVVLSS